MVTIAPPLQISRYEVLGELGSGAMGVVYKARDPLIDRLVAVKAIDVTQGGAEALSFRQRIFREARSAGGLNHPNIVTIHDVGESGDVAYIAMEYLPGQSLREILDSGTVLPVARIADIAAQIADGLAFAHQKGIVHRDIKPANVMVLDNGVVKITDFGIALLPSGTRTIAGTVFGSPKYISPERLRGDRVDGRSDFFSLGAVLYEMLTGVPPFTGTDLNSLLNQILSVMPIAPSSRNRNIPPAFDFIVGTALAKDPAERYRDAQAMAEDLRHYADLGAGKSLATPMPVPADTTAQPPGGGDPAPRHNESLAAAKPEPLVPLLEAHPVGARPIELPSHWRMTALLITPVVLLVLVAVVALWPRETTAPASSQPATVTAPEVAPIRKIDVPVPAVAPVPKAAAPATVVASGPVGNPAPTNGAAVAPPPQTATSGAAAIRVPDLPKEGAVAASKEGAAVAPKESAAVAPKENVAVVPKEGAAGATKESVAVVPKEGAAGATKEGAAAAAKPTAVLGFAVAPWGEVYVNGKKVGVSPPLAEIKLAPGKYAVEIRNTTFPAYRETIELRAQTSIRIRHKFQ